MSDGPSEAAEAAGDSRHTLTEEERQWCLDLRKELEVQGIPEPEPRSDFFLAQFALIGKGKLDETVGRVKRYNEVISGEYGYKGANEALDTDSYGSCNKIFPGMMHMCAPQMAKQHPTMVADVRKYLPKRLNTEKGDIRNMMIDMMISLDSMSADLDDIRKGMCFVQQCQGMGMSNYSHKVEKEASKVYQDAYPVRYAMVPFVNIGLFFRVLIKFLKLFLKEKVRERILLCNDKDLYFAYGFDQATMPGCVGGSIAYETPEESHAEYDGVIRENLKRRDESILKVKI